MSEHRYTARDMHEASEGLVDSCVADSISILVGHGNLKVVTGDRIADMLRQAADAEEDLAHLRDEQIRLVAENARLAARLEAVVKECENKVRETSCDDCRDAINGLGGKKLRCNDWPMCTRQEKHIFFDAILRAARGESENENK